MTVYYARYKVEVTIRKTQFFFSVLWPNVKSKRTHDGREDSITCCWDQHVKYSTANTAKNLGENPADNFAANLADNHAENPANNPADKPYLNKKPDKSKQILLR